MSKRKLSVEADETYSPKKARFLDDDEEDEDESEMDISAIEAMIPSQEMTSQLEQNSMASIRRISVSFY